VLGGGEEGVRPAPSRQISCIGRAYIALNLIGFICFTLSTTWSERIAKAASGALESLHANALMALIVVTEEQLSQVLMAYVRWHTDSGGARPYTRTIYSAVMHKEIP